MKQKQLTDALIAKTAAAFAVKAPLNVTDIERISIEVFAERMAQIEQWGGAEHDDTHRPGEWLGFIRQQIGKVNDDALRVAFMDAIDEALISSIIRARLIKIAALALAGVESIDRKAK